MDNPKRIFALGFFDGVHLGHQALLRRCVELSQACGCESAAITFDNHPKALVWQEPPVLISTCADRRTLLRDCGIRYIRQLPVIPEVMGMPWQEFIRELLRDGAAGFVCGDDFRFGWKGEGNADRLQEFCREQNLPCIVVPEQLIDGIRISSSCIRGKIEQGQMDSAVRFLGHPHILTAPSPRFTQVCPGSFTASLPFPKGLVVPKPGSYVCRVRMGEECCPALTRIFSQPGGDIFMEVRVEAAHAPNHPELTLEFYGSSAG